MSIYIQLNDPQKVNQVNHLIEFGFFILYGIYVCTCVRYIRCSIIILRAGKIKVSHFKIHLNWKRLTSIISLNGCENCCFKRMLKSPRDES